MAYATYARTLQDRNLRVKMFSIALETSDEAGRMRSANSEHITSLEPTIEGYFIRALMHLDIGNLEEARANLTEALYYLESINPAGTSNLNNRADPASIKRYTASLLSTVSVWSTMHHVVAVSRRDLGSIENVQYLLARIMDDLVFPEPGNPMSLIDLAEDLDVHHKLNLVEQACISTVLTGLTNGRKAASHQVQGTFALITRLFGPVDRAPQDKKLAAPLPSSPPKSRGSIRNIVSRHRREKASKQPELPTIPHNMPHDRTEPPIKHKDQPPRQDQRLVSQHCKHCYTSL